MLYIYIYFLTVFDKRRFIKLNVISAEEFEPQMFEYNYLLNS